MERVYQEAFAEVDEILKIMPIELLSKIPIRFREVISENKAKDYNVEINEDFEEEKLKEETIVILGLIYRDFLASPDEREELQIKDAEELKRIEQDLQQQYDIGNVFKNKKTANVYSSENCSTELTIYKEAGFVKKLFNFIKKIFSKK